MDVWMDDDRTYHPSIHPFNIHHPPLSIPCRCPPELRRSRPPSPASSGPLGSSWGAWWVALLGRTLRRRWCRACGPAPTRPSTGWHGTSPTQTTSSTSLWRPSPSALVGVLVAPRAVPCGALGPRAACVLGAAWTYTFLCDLLTAPALALLQPSSCPCVLQRRHGRL
jgi:hypothetical protein